jgi:hypothetical protein
MRITFSAQNKQAVRTVSQIATGCVNIQGTIDGITYTPTTIKNFPIKGKVETDVYVGGTRRGEKTVNYQGGGANGWSNFVHIPAGEEIIINVLDYGDVHNFAKIEVVTYHRY